jgi:hypothetical protein
MYPIIGANSSRAQKNFSSSLERARYSYDGTKTKGFAGGTERIKSGWGTYHPRFLSMRWNKAVRPPVTRYTSNFSLERLSAGEADKADDTDQADMISKTVSAMSLLSALSASSTDHQKSYTRYFETSKKRIINIYFL